MWGRQQRLHDELLDYMRDHDSFLEPFKDPKTGRLDYETYQTELTVRARSALCPLPPEHPARPWLVAQEEAKLSLREQERGEQRGKILGRHLAETIELKERHQRERADFEEHFDARFDERWEQMQATAHQGVRPVRGRKQERGRTA